MMGIFLPFTIYLQSALGFSALKAGLTMAPASIISMFVAPVAGRMTDKIGGKYILMSGLMLFAIGFGLTAVIATTASQWQDFIWTLSIAGLGMGCTFAPMTTVAMRNIEPRVAGAASGMINTVRQVGAVIGTAAVGALPNNRLAAALPVAAARCGLAAAGAGRTSSPDSRSRHSTARPLTRPRAATSSCHRARLLRWPARFIRSPVKCSQLGT
jgi:MFS family permease